MKSQRYQSELKQFLLNSPKTKLLTWNTSHCLTGQKNHKWDTQPRSFSFDSPKTKWFTFKPHTAIHKDWFIYILGCYLYSPWVSCSRRTQTSSAEMIGEHWLWGFSEQNMFLDQHLFVVSRTMCVSNKKSLPFCLHCRTDLIGW